MSFTRWLYMNNDEKMKILMYILPVFIISYIIESAISKFTIISIIVGLIITIVITAYKNKYYVNIIANRYIPQLTVTLKQTLIQNLAATVVNGLLAGLLIVICGAMWLLTLATMSWLIFIAAAILSLISIIAFIAVSKLSFIVLLKNAEDKELTFRSFFNIFPDVYQTYFKLVLKTQLKALAYSFIIVVILSFVSIYASNNGATVLMIITSLITSFVVYWVDVTVVQYLIREYSR